MFREPSKLVEITRFGCVSSTQNSCRKTIINVEAAIGRPVMSTNNCACSTRYLLVNVTHISMCCSNKPLIRVQSTNWVCEYGPRSPTHFFVLGQLTLFSSVCIYGSLFHDAFLLKTCIYGASEMIKMNYTYHFSLKLLFLICCSAPIEHLKLNIKYLKLNIKYLKLNNHGMSCKFQCFMFQGHFQFGVKRLSKKLSLPRIVYKIFN